MQCMAEKSQRQRSELSSRKEAAKTDKPVPTTITARIRHLPAILAFAAQLDAAEQADRVMITRAVRTAQFAQITEILDAFD